MKLFQGISKLVKSELQVIKDSHRIIINRRNIYENTEDNIAFYLGQFSYDSEAELKFIIEKLGELDD